jgi:hypothetical protein
VARTGGFGGGVNPFGTGSIGSLSQYDIGADLADLEVYKVEVAWGNGLATDEAYLAALTKAMKATDPGTQRRESAVNKLDDATYRIGRSKAEQLGLDQLIAFDAAAIAKMNPSNVRYRDVQDSLQSEQASRRSRDYGKLVTAYNAGKTTTQSLLAWVSTQLGALTKDDPDFTNWTQVKGDLTDRIVSEKDTKVYQDYQQGRTKAPAFLAYITSRRDGYTPGTPQYTEWANKVEDAQKQIADNAQSEKDSAFFNKYQEGKVSDTAYLTYLGDRIKGMKPDDPSLGDWKHRLVAATFSLAEDKLRFDVGRGKAPASRLIAFYKSYQRTLNPGSAEWRTVQRNLDTLHGGTTGGGSGGVGTRRRTTGGTGGSGGGAGGVGNAIGGKVITGGKYTLDNVMGVFSIDPNASKSQISAAKKYLDNNKSSLNNALQNGDKVWLFTDPRKPDAVVAELDPQGNPTGRMVRGAAYLPALSETYSNILLAEAGNWNAASELALTRHKYGDAALYGRRAAEAFDNARKSDAGYRAQNTADYAKNLMGVIDQATKAGDYGLAARTGAALSAELAGQLSNPYLTDTERNKLNTMGEKLFANPLIGRDPNTGAERALNLESLGSGEVVLNDGWHHTLKTTNTGSPDWGPEFSLDPEWDAKHVTVATSFGGKVVQGDVVRDKGSVTDTIIHTDTGEVRLPMGANTQYISFVDERGQIVRAYSHDGDSWVMPGAGMPAPMLEFNGGEPLVTKDGGKTYALASDPTTVILAQDATGQWAPTADATGMIGWYGEAAFRAAKQAGPYSGATFSLQQREQMTGVERIQAIDSMEVGGPGMHMTLAGGAGSDPRWQGTVNLVSPSFYRTDYMSRPGFSRQDKEQMTVAERKKVTVNDDLFARLKGGTQLPGQPHALDTYEQDIERTRLPVLKAQLDAQMPPSDRYDGYELGRGHKVPDLKPKPPAPSFAGGAKKAVLGPPVPTLKDRAVAVSLSLKPKAVLPPTLKGKGADDLVLPKPKPLPKIGAKKAGFKPPKPRTTVVSKTSVAPSTARSNRNK